MTDAIFEQWKQLAVELGDNVYRTVNTPETVGTDDETGYVLMFFSAKNHQGQSTLVSSALDKADLKKLLKVAIRGLNKASIVGPSKYAN